MIKNPTVLVLGAGASVPFGFPAGQSLKDKICSTEFISQMGLMNLLGFDSKEFKKFSFELSRSGRPSVDSFLEHRGEFVDIGKAAIASALLPLENTSQLFESSIKKRRNSPNRKEDNWYDLLFSELCDGIPFDEVNKNKRLSVITFNYDRSLEQYLFIALKYSYGKTDEECSEQLKNIPIIHVHGSLGWLPWQSTTNSNAIVPYDSKVTMDNVSKAAGSIKIIPEATMDTAEFNQAQSLMLKSGSLLLLGFGYHPTNIKRLAPEFIKLPVYVKGTSLGLSYERKVMVKAWHERLNEEDGLLVPKDVYTFLHDYVSFSEPGLVVKGD